MTNNQCSACTRCTVEYDRCFAPVDFVLGDPKARFWIIGINPAAEGKAKEPKTEADLKNYFRGFGTHTYFNAFHKVLTELGKGLFSGKGVAHTDLVKCPMAVDTKEWAAVSEACGGEVLIPQLERAKPDFLLCNGVPVSEFVSKHVTPVAESPATPGKYVGMLGDQKVTVFRTGFIQRLDRYSQSRLGEQIAREWPPHAG